MGHDIYSYRKIGYLRRNMWSKDIKKLYKYLKAEDRNAGVSGDGKDEWIEYATVENAINSIKNDTEFETEENREEFITFLQKTLDNNSGEQFIKFYFS